MSCRLCGYSTPRLLMLGGLAYADCPRCGYLALDRRHFPARTAEVTRYRLHRNDPAEPGYRAYLETFIAAALSPNLRPGASVLDFGSGPVPSLALLLGERGFKAAAYDPYFAPGSGWRRRAWDAIVVHEVAEHLRSPRRSLRSLARRLAPGAVLAVRTRFAPRDESKLEDWWYRRDSTHLGFFRPSSFIFLAHELGLGLALLAEPDTAVLRRDWSEPFGKTWTGPPSSR